MASRCILLAVGNLRHLDFGVPVVGIARPDVNHDHAGPTYFGTRKVPSDT